MLFFIGFILMCAIPHGKLPHTSHLNNIHCTGSYHLEQRIAIYLGTNACGYISNSDGRLLVTGAGKTSLSTSGA
jgi:hypothetical protein